MIDKDEIALMPLLDEDIPLFDRWLNKDYIYKWQCTTCRWSSFGLGGVFW